MVGKALRRAGPRKVRIPSPAAGGQALRLTYASQSETRLDRLIRAREKAKARAHGEGSYPKPRARNRERLLQRWIDLEEATDDLFTAETVRRFGLNFR